ncbi:hypothetical protein PFNF135_00146 [Plasmodium falciparum NF135/5.C10]|uniref:Plasmodium falciparum erythrocyte membrane protein 1 acidic terminal segment domain-containing protein n=1 Tax=Plasmodium falciparum NF135/5.C10 TaxID=1036726 RepID=W4IPQ0_PLAFA|nr:hypothetical protein PFNF135_00146 [Plasmodium falciparum NF135/5.C10]
MWKAINLMTTHTLEIYLYLIKFPKKVILLEPTKRDTFNIPSGDTHTNKFTDDDSNQLKQDFIYQYLQNIQKDLPSEKYH